MLRRRAVAQTRVGIRNLKAQLSAYIREVKNGKTIDITEHGQVVARLSPVPKTIDDKIAAMVASGMANWNGKPLPPVKYRPKVRGTKTLSDMLIEDRE